MYRSSTGNLSGLEEPVRGERWDRDRFERMRGGRGRGGGGEHDHYRFQEHDRFPGGRRDIDIHEDYDRRGPRVMERERFREDERFDVPSRRRHDIFPEDTPSEVANRALAPYRRKSIVERDMDVAPRRPARPQYLRRQSSLDTFDRRPMPRYGDVERIDRIEQPRDEWRPPTNVPIPLPIRERRRSPPRYEDDFEEIRYTEREREREPRRSERVEEYREVEVSRAKSKRRRSRSRARSVPQSARSSSTSSFEEVSLSRANWGKRGKTRLPKRLCRKEAVIDLGYPFEEEDDFLVITRALEKEHIDEIIKVSESFKERESKTTYVYENKDFVEAAPPPPPPPPEVMHVPPPPPSIAPSHHSHMHMHAPPPPPAPASVHYAQSVRSSSPSHHGHEVYEERIEESNHIGGPLTVLVPGHDEHRLVRREVTVRDERDIKDEIRALERERRMLKYERDSDFEIIERRDPKREVIRVDKDRKGRLALVRSTH
ncbi:hypothetical protein CC80DRAFT_403898 [Byssothecium circinans]|uniref:DUF8035 domain-containing protein n=1 Tax=Byssothecium circinans TaxID=147558 RepID=A0A6A5U6B0_9PLEO|nr:hypothetical protein CC80DRAFT_403898 [Byssothecium circinans]